MYAETIEGAKSSPRGCPFGFFFSHNHIKETKTHQIKDKAALHRKKDIGQNTVSSKRTGERKRLALKKTTMKW